MQREQSCLKELAAGQYLVQTQAHTAFHSNLGGFGAGAVL